MRNSVAKKIRQQLRRQRGEIIKALIEKASGFSFAERLKIAWSIILRKKQKEGELWTK